MNRALFLAGLAPLWLLGCGNDHGFGPPDDTDVDVDAGAGASVPAQLGGLPCDVKTFLAAHCQGCHGSTPSNGAPMSLMSYRDLTATNRSGAVIAARALARITDPASPMPPIPAPAVSGADVAMFQRWVDSGTPRSDCGAEPPPVPTVPGPFDGPTVCTSGRMWTGGDQESPLMHPGRACVACHATGGGGDDDHGGDKRPLFSIAGTVYPTGHEPDDCNGAAAATVEVTDAAQKVTILPVNGAGNFFTISPIAFPIHVAVVVGGKRRAMGASPPSGDCNSCHTEHGANMAPGRIALP